jgi:hypothetical protein
MSSIWKKNLFGTGGPAEKVPLGPVAAVSRMETCPNCGQSAYVNPAPFSPFVSVLSCDSCRVRGIQCDHCHKAMLRKVSENETTIHAVCDKCGHTNDKIPLAWWRINVR